MCLNFAFCFRSCLVLLFFLLQKCCCFFLDSTKSFFVSISCFVLAASLLINFVSWDHRVEAWLHCMLNFAKICFLVAWSGLQRFLSCSHSWLSSLGVPTLLLFPMSLSNCEGSRNSLSLFKVQDVVFSLCRRKIVSAKAVSTACSCTCYRRFPEQYLAAGAAVTSHVS